MSEHTLHEKFFDNLWPLILDTNRCAVQGLTDQEFFEPVQTFDHLGAHNFLVERGYADYEMPVAISCYPAKKNKEAQSCKTLSPSSSTCDRTLRPSKTLEPNTRKWGSSTTSSLSTNQSSTKWSMDSDHQLYYPKRYRTKCILPLQTCKPNKLSLSRLKYEPKEKNQEPINEHNSFVWPEESKRCLLNQSTSLALKEQFVLQRLEARKVLEHNFVERTIPWYYNEQRCQIDNSTIEQLYQQFIHSTLECNVLQSVYKNNCKALIMNLGLDVGIDELQRWQKFCNTLHFIVVARCPIIERQIRLCGDTFHALSIQSNFESTWQEELTQGLEVGFKYALEHRILEHCAQNFVFIFSKDRGFCHCDTFCVLRKT